MKEEVKNLCDDCLTRGICSIYNKISYIDLPEDDTGEKYIDLDVTKCKFYIK